MEDRLFTIAPNADMWHANDFAFVVLDASPGAKEYDNVHCYTDTFDIAVDALKKTLSAYVGAAAILLDPLHNPEFFRYAYLAALNDADRGPTLAAIEATEAQPTDLRHIASGAEVVAVDLGLAEWINAAPARPYAVEVTVPLSYTEPLQIALSSALNSLQADLKLARQFKSRPISDGDSPTVVEFKTRYARIRQERVEALTRQIEAVEGVMRQVASHV